MKKITKTVASLMVCTSIISTIPSVNQVLADGVSETQSTAETSTQNSLSNNDSSLVNQNSVSNNDGQSVQKHALSKPYVVYGAGLSQSEQQQVGQVLGVTDSFETLTATANDYREFINANSSETTNSEMISSVALEPTDPDSGVKVNIKNFDGENNITQVTSQQYAMVATLAGVKDMNIIVTAPRSVSGTSALTGVYVALQKDGITLNNENTAVANDMLNATQDAVSQNNNDPKYAGQLSNAVMNTAKEVAQNKQDGQTMNEGQVQKLLNDNLAKQGIENKTPSSTVNNITNIITNKFQNAPVAKNKNFINNADNTVSNITKGIKNGAKQMFNSDEFKKNLPSENWFVSMWHKIVNWFNSIFSHNDNETEDNQSQNNNNVVNKQQNNNSDEDSKEKNTDKKSENEISNSENTDDTNSETQDNSSSENSMNNDVNSESQSIN